MALFLAVGVYGLMGKPVRLPVWVVAEIEDRLNASAAPVAQNLSLSVGGIELMLDTDWVPRLALEDVRVLQPDGDAILTLPEVRAAFEPSALLGGAVRPLDLRIVGGRLAVRRDADGRFDLDFGSADTGANWVRPVDILDSIDAVFSQPSLADLRSIKAEGLTLQLTDAVTGQQWQAGDGRIVLDNRTDELAVELGLSLSVDAAKPARVVLTSISAKSTSEARVTATVDGVAARDLAAQAGPLAWLGVLDASISGRIVATIGAQGDLGPLESDLQIGQGVLRPTPLSAPIAFDKAGMTLSYDPDAGRIGLTALTVESPSLRLTADGQSFLVDQKGSPISGSLLGARADAFVTQIRFSEVMVDPEGLFQEPVRFSQGALDLRLTLAPFAIEIGQLSLTEQDRTLSLKGRAEAGQQGWRVALDVALNKIQSDRLIALWPVNLVSKTRAWLSANVLEGTLYDVKAAVRLAPGQTPRFSLGYDFANTDVKFLKTLPPVRQSSGYSSIDGQSYTLVLEKGHVTPPLGGKVDVTGSVFKVLDISQKPATAEVTLRSQSSLTAALSLLDEPPFRFLTKANRPVDLGTGEARLLTTLRFPLKQKVLLEDVFYTVTGEISDLRSDLLVPGHPLAAPKASLVADRSGLKISGKGTVASLPFDVTFSQGFGPEAKGRSDVSGLVQITDDRLRDLGVQLPRGMISGEGQATISVKMTKGQPPMLNLVSDLGGLVLDVAPLGWTKSRGTKGRLELDAELGKIPSVKRMEIDAAGLQASGTVKLKGGGELDEAAFDHVRLDDWLDVAVTLQGRGKGTPVGILVEGGRADLRPLARAGGGGGESGPMQVRLDRLAVSNGIALTGFEGEFTSKGGFNGAFTAMVNGDAAVEGVVVPTRSGTAVRIAARNAGRVMAAAGVFANARGGELDLLLTPTGQQGDYLGQARIGPIRVRNASVLAELLSAISVVGILEQLNGKGLVFSQADVEFRLTPDAVEVTRGSAIGASLGVSMAGVYQMGTKRLRMQGVISPVYMLNGIGAILTRRGEGLFGFNYKIGGTSDAPDISVNPLSILTPGMFRDLFRKPAPTLPEGNG